MPLSDFAVGYYCNWTRSPMVHTSKRAHLAGRPEPRIITADIPNPPAIPMPNGPLPYAPPSATPAVEFPQPSALSNVSDFTALDPDAAFMPLLYLKTVPGHSDIILQSGPGQWTKNSDLLEDIHRGQWFEIHRNLVSYVLYTLRFQDGPSNEIAQLSKQWAQWDVVTSLANYRSVVQILFGYLNVKDSRNLSTNVSTPLSEDISRVLRQTHWVLSDRATYKHFLSCRGTVAQQLLDLLQDLLDSSRELRSRALLFKALLRLSGKCELHPNCFTLIGLERVGPQVGGGGFGDIWKGVTVGGQIVAVKSMRQFRDDDVKASLKKLGREALIWRQLSHPNLLPFFGLYMLDNRLSLVSPWMDNGDLKHFLNNGLSDVDRVSLITDVVMGLDYLHSKHVVHGDLKTPNILVTPSGRACIADFGLSTIVDELSLKMTFSTHSGRAGTVRYQAPELLMNERPIHFGSDVYAFACVSYEILAGKVPFFELANDAAIILKVIEGFRPSRVEVISPDLWLLLSDSWHQETDRRPTTAAILRRLLTQPIGQELRQSPPDWDDTYSARFRRSLQEWPLIPAIDETEQMIPSDATTLDDALLAFRALDLADDVSHLPAHAHADQVETTAPLAEGFSWILPSGYGSPPALGPVETTAALEGFSWIPPSGYGSPTSGYGSPTSSYGSPTSGYGFPTSGYGSPTSGYGSPPALIPVETTAAPDEGTPFSGYSSPTSDYGFPPSGYGSSISGYRFPPALDLVETTAPLAEGFSWIPTSEYLPTGAGLWVHSHIHYPTASFTFYFDLAETLFAPRRLVSGTQHEPPQSKILDAAELCETVIRTPLTALRIVHPDIPLWPIDIKMIPPDEMLSISLGDVLSRIHAEMHQCISHEEWLSLQERERLAVTTTFTRHCRDDAWRRYAPESVKDGELAIRKEGVKRVHFLENTVFKGLVPMPWYPPGWMRMVTAEE